MIITKITAVYFTDINPTWYVYSDQYPNGEPCNPSTFLPELYAQSPSTFRIILLTEPPFTILQFDTNAPTVNDVLFFTQPHGSSSLHALTVFQSSNNLGANTGVHSNAYTAKTANTIVEIDFVVPKVNSTFAADWSIVLVNLTEAGAPTIAAVGSTWHVTFKVSTTNNLIITDTTQPGIIQLLAAS